MWRGENPLADELGSYAQMGRSPKEKEVKMKFIIIQDEEQEQECPVRLTLSDNVLVLRAQDSKGLWWNLLKLFPDGTSQRSEDIPVELGFKLDEWNRLDC